MTAQQILQAILLLDTLLNKGPALLAALKSVLASTDEDELKAQLASLEASNNEDYARLKALLAPADPT